MLLKTILVTGYDGFIGTNLVNSLTHNYKIIGLSKTKNSKFEFKQIKKDILKTSPKDIKENISYLIHLAALTDVVYCQKYSSKCFQTNVIGTQNILELARKKKSKVIFLSSSHVYGIPHRIPVKENDPTNPISMYGVSKLASEIICEAYSKTYGMDISILRLFSVYGKKKLGNDVISKIIYQLDKGTVKLGNIKPKRDFVYIDDVINAVKIVMKNCKGFNCFNVGTGKSYSIFEVYSILKKLTGKNSKIKSLKSIQRKTDVANMVANCSNLNKLGWKPNVSLNEGLEKIC